MRLLVEHLKNVAFTLKQHAAVAGVANHGDVKGSAREAIAEYFLRDHMSDSVTYLTGEVFDRADTRSGQIDLIIHPHGAPRLNLLGKVNLVFADWVLATMEVKSTLKTASVDAPSHLKSALDSCVKLKAMITSGDSFLNLPMNRAVGLEKIPYFLFAFDGPTVDTLREKLGRV